MPIVRLYPVGEVSPQPLPNARIDVPAAGDINLFGGNRAQDLQLAGQRLGQASDSLFAIYERKAKAANDTRVQDFNNQYITGEREILRTGPDAYYKQGGADAIAGADAATGRLTALKDQLLGQAGNDYQRQRLRPILDTHLAASVDGIARHAGEQQAVYERSVAAAAIETSRAEAVASPANLPNAMFRAEGAARALYGGQAPEVVERQALQAGSSVVAAVIAGQLGRSDPEGLALFRQYADRLDPHERRTLGAAAEMLPHTIAAADWLRARSATLAAAPAPTGDAALDAVNVASAGAGEPPPVTSWAGRLLDREGIVGHRERLAGIEERRRALTTLNEQEFADDPARLRANRTAIQTDAARSRAAAKAESDKAYADLQAHLATGGPGGGPAVTLPPATILSRFTAEQQDAVAAQVNRAIEGKRTRTDQPTWYAIRQGLTGDDADERKRWADANLVQFRGQLSDEDFAALSRLQTTMRSNDDGAEARREQAITRMANRALIATGIDPTPRPETDATHPETFRRALNDELAAFESSKGRPATAADAQAIVTELATRALKGGWLDIGEQRISLNEAAKPTADQQRTSQTQTDDTWVAQNETAERLLANEYPKASASFTPEEIAPPRTVTTAGTAEPPHAVSAQYEAPPDDTKDTIAEKLLWQTAEPNVMSDAEDEGLQDGQRYAAAPSRGGGQGNVRPLTNREERDLRYYRYKLDRIHRLEPNNPLVQPRVTAEVGPVSRQQVRRAEEELSRAEARAAQRNLEREEQARGETPRDTRPTAGDLVRGSVPGGLSSHSSISATPPPQVRLPTQQAQLAHIFANREGHIPDTPSNRRLLLDVANDRTAIRGLDRFGNIRSERLLPDGRQVWTRVRDGVIQNGGINDVPRASDPKAEPFLPTPQKVR